VEGVAGGRGWAGSGLTALPLSFSCQKIKVFLLLFFQKKKILLFLKKKKQKDFYFLRYAMTTQPSATDFAGRFFPDVSSR
jgi:hypothetical protein